MKRAICSVTDDLMDEVMPLGGPYDLEELHRAFLFPENVRVKDFSSKLNGWLLELEGEGLPDGCEGEQCGLARVVKAWYELRDGERVFTGFTLCN